jgi:DNA-binding Lrp family transcriptional regulator
MDSLDRDIINNLQGGFPICENPYAHMAEKLGTDESSLIMRIEDLLQQGYLSRFGPMYHAERLGGGLTLAAMSIPSHDFERVVKVVNKFDEVAHNYERTHKLNMWFVLATETQERIQEVIDEIQQQTGYTVYNMPKEKEFFVGLKFEV